MTQDARLPEVKQCAATCPSKPLLPPSHTTEEPGPPIRHCHSTWDCKWWKGEKCVFLRKGINYPPPMKPGPDVYYCK